MSDPLGLDEMAMATEEEDARQLPDRLLSKANRELKKQILEYEDKAEEQKKQGEINSVRVAEMKKHLENVKEEIKNTQDLEERQKKDIETEDHMAQLAEREIGGILERTKALMKEKEEVQDKLDALSNAIFKSDQRMEQLKVGMAFNQNELEQWDIARKQKEDDALALEKYHRVDDAKTKELNLGLEKLTKKVTKKHQELLREITETQAAQIQLNKTAEDYQQLQRERRGLIQQWEEAIKAMHARDEAIKSAGERFAQGKSWQVKRTEQLKDRAAFLNVEQQNNKELEGKIQAEDRVLVKFRADHTAINTMLTQLDDQLEVLKNTLTKATQDLNAKKTKKNNLASTLQDKREYFERVKSGAEEKKIKLDKEIANCGNLEEQSKIIANLLSETEGTLAKLGKEMEALRAEKKKKEDAMNAVMRQQQHYFSLIGGAEAQNKNMQDKIRKLDQETFKQQELLYNIEFNVQQMERKVNRAKGERTEEEKKELKEKIGMLQTMLDDLEKQHKVLAEQVKRVRQEVGQANEGLKKRTNDKGSAKEKFHKLTTENKSREIEKDRLSKEKKEVLLLHDKMKLKIKERVRHIEDSAQELLGLENRKEQLHITGLEKELGVQTDMDIARAQCKAAEEELKAVRKELNKREKDAENLKNRFAVLSNRIPSSDEADGDVETTHAQYVVKTAKEREELQAHGDKLDEEIKRMEKEALKLDRTIMAMKKCNSAFAAQFKRATAGDTETQTKSLLEKHTRDVQTVVNKRTHDMKQCLSNELSKKAELQEVQRDGQELSHKIHILREGMEGINKGIAESRNVVGRLNTAIANLKRNVGPTEAEDVDFQEEKERVQNAIASLIAYADHHDDVNIRDEIRLRLQQAGLDAPRAAYTPGPAGSDSGTA